MLAAVALAACAGRPPSDLDGTFDEICARAENALDHGRVENAERFLARAVPLAQAAGRRSAEQARVNLDLARLRRAQGDPRRARHYLALARFAARAAHGEDSLEMAAVQQESARQNRLSGRHDAAVGAAEKVLEIRRAHLPPDDPLVLEALHDLAWSHHLAFQYPRAVETYEKILSLTDGGHRISPRDHVIVLNRLGWIYERAGLPEKQSEYNARARALVASATGGGGSSAALLELGLEGLAAPTPELRAAMRGLRDLASDWIATRRFHLEHFAFERQLLVGLRRLDRGIPLSKVRRDLARDLGAEFVAFAPPRKRSDSGHRYGLPFEPGTPRRMVRTSEGAHGYDRVFLHAVDFEVPPGSAVLAARDGTVARVVDGFDPAAAAAADPQADLRHGIEVNRVVVLHDDGTYASYQPLASPIEVEEGQTVVRGQRLGRTAHVPDGRTPIVHFDVRRNGTSAGSGGILTPQPVRTRFADVPDRDGIPLADHAYENRFSTAVPASPAPTSD